MMYACGVSQNSKIPFCHVIESIVMFSLPKFSLLSIMVVKFIADRPFFCLFSSLKNYSLRILVVDISTSFLFFLFLIFCYDFFVEVLFVSVSSLNINLPNIIFSNLVLNFWIFNLFSLVLL
jgi:hypothetical protein